MTPSRIARTLGLVGVAAFLALAARTSTATPAFEDDPTLPPSIPVEQLSPAFDAPIIVAPVPTIPPPPPPMLDPEPKDKDEDKPTKKAEPVIEPLPIAPANSFIDLGGDDLAPIAPAPESPNVDPPKAPEPVVDDLLPEPVRVEPRKAWRAEREGAPGRTPTPADAAVEIPSVNIDDPDAQARSFVERNQREAEARLKTLNDEAESLRVRLAKVEAAIGQWQALVDAMKGARDAATAPKAAAAPEPRAARAQDVPAPPLR